jgi:excisionase family DNA binding protein
MELILDQIAEILNSQKKVESLLLSQKTFLTFNELAEYTGLSKSYLYKLSMNFKIPGMYRPMGKQLYFDRKEVDQWLLTNKETA